MVNQVSIVIPNLHSPVIDQTLLAIRQQHFDLSRVEVIVVGCDRHRLVHEDELVRFLDTGRPVSPAVARNLGLAQAAGEVVVFTDADCVPAEDWLSNLMAAYGTTPGRTVVGGAVGFDDANYWTLSDNISTFYQFLPSRAPGRRLHLPSLNFSAYRSVLEAVGGFDERYPQPAGEDTDLSLRLRQAGHELYFEPRAVVYHRPPRQSLAALLRHARDFGRFTPRMRPEYGDLLGWPAPLRQPALILALSPLLAAGVTLRIFIADVALRRYWYTAPAIFLAKLAWCVGAAQQAKFQISDPSTELRAGFGFRISGPSIKLKTCSDSSTGSPRRFAEEAEFGPLNRAQGRIQVSDQVRTTDPHVAIIVLNWNRCEDTLECLASLYNMTHAKAGNTDVILVDNGSTDGTVETVKAEFPEAEVISLPENLGFAAGCNVGLRRALELAADYVLLINNDAVVAPDILEHLISVAKTHPDVGLLGPVIYRFDKPNQVWSAGYRQRPIMLSAQPPAGQPEASVPYEVDRLYGAGLLIRRQVLEDVGLFDERFFMYYEDADLCRRAQEAGYRLMVVPSAHMWHKVSASTGEGSPVQKFHLARSSVLFFAKHTPLPLLPVIIVYRLGVATKQISLAARWHRWDIISAYLRGLWSGLKLLRE